jgi:hypothetical protein
MDVMAKNAEELGLRLYALCYDGESAPADAAVQSLIAKGADVNTESTRRRMHVQSFIGLSIMVISTLC